MKKSVLDYLKKAKHKIGINQSNVLCIGNVAGDLDSCVCSVVYAMYKDRIEEKNFLPVLNFDANEFHIRPDVKFMFERIGIEKKDLVFENEIKHWKENHEMDKEIILLDHNKPINDWIQNDKILEIIDHHKDEKTSGKLLKKVKIERVGSCASLVAQEILHGDEKILYEYPEITELLLGTILLDTVNLCKEVKKATEVDFQAVDELSKIIEYDTAKKNKLFEIIKKEKFNLSALSDNDVLKGDYKAVNKDIGICSCRRLIKDEKEIKKFYEEKKLKLLFVMTQRSENNKFLKDLSVYSPSNNFNVSNVIDFLNHKGMKLEFKEEYSNIFSRYHQKNLAMSRKHLTPFIEEFLKE